MVTFPLAVTEPVLNAPKSRHIDVQLFSRKGGPASTSRLHRRVLRPRVSLRWPRFSLCPPNQLDPPKWGHASFADPEPTNLRCHVRWWLHQARGLPLSRLQPVPSDGDPLDLNSLIGWIGAYEVARRRLQSFRCWYCDAAVAD